ncbi:MAG: hypothetical protein ABJZ55_17785 [Fuerstiella sp.]
MDVILGLVFIFSLLSLAMIFGDRLSLFGNVDDRWLMTPFDLVSRFWQMLCEIFDRAVCFVFDHFWWVAATASGGIGVVMIALVMFSGLTLEAAAVRRDELAIMNVGGVLDHTPRMSAKDTMPQRKKLLSENSSHLVDQFPTPNNRFAIQELSRRPEIDILPVERPYLPIQESAAEYTPTPDPFRSRLRLTLNPFVEIQGRPFKDPLLSQMIQQALYDIQQDDWQAFSNLGFQNRQVASQPDLSENSTYDVNRLLKSVRILSGDTIATQAIDVQKLVPENPPAGEFDIRIRIRNMGRDTLSGLIIREQIPLTAAAKAMQPLGVYRDTTAVWVVDNLRSGEERDLVLTVEARDLDRFESWTEVSAASAVRAATTVEEARRFEPLRLPPVELDPPEPRRPIVEPREERREPTLRLPEREEPVPRLPIRREPIRRELVRPVPDPAPIKIPDVRLRVLTKPVRVKVNEVAIVKFEVRNVGNADAEGVSLRVNLPTAVDHKQLDPRDIIRRVESSVRILQPNERRTMELFIRPTRTGDHLVTALLMLKDRELDIQSFDVEAGDRKNSRDEFPPMDEAVPPPIPDRGIR